MSDIPEFDPKDSPLDKARYKQFMTDSSGSCFEETDSETFDIGNLWYCVYSPLDVSFICRQLSIPQAFLIDPSLEGYNTKQECSDSCPFPNDPY